MIFKLPSPVRGETHISLYRLDEVVGAWVEARGFLGRMPGGEFERADGIRDVLIAVNGDTYGAFLDFAQGEGAPEGEFRKADLVDYVFDSNTSPDFTWI